MIERATLSRILPFGTYIFFIALEDMLKKMGMGADDLRWLYPLKTVLIIAILWGMRAEYSELKMPRGKGVLTWIIAVAAGLFVFVAWINLNASWMMKGVSPGVDLRGAGRALDWFFIVVRWSGAALVVPLMEELFWRSFLMRWVADKNFLAVDPARVGWMAFLVIAVLFASEHPFWFAGFWAGVVYNALYMHSKTLWSPILAHSVTNGVLGGWVLMTGNWSYW